VSIRAAQSIRVAFFCWAAFHFTMTHWPNLKVPGPVPRTDLWVHLMAFGGWTAFLCLAGFFGPRLGPRNLGLCWLIGLANALLDEGLQGIPIVQRHCAWDDATANMIGATAAVCVLMLLALLRRS